MKSRQQHDENDRVIQLHIELMNVVPKVWRRVLVPASVSLPTLHEVLQTAMGWNNSHAHEFVFGGTTYSDLNAYEDVDDGLLAENFVNLRDALKAQDFHIFVYVYDPGDHWIHRVTVEKLQPEYVELSAPTCIAGENACPPEDVGGTAGYEEFLEIIGNTEHPERDVTLAWCGGSWDPLAFNLVAVNEELQ